MTQNIYANIIGRYKICFLQNDYNLPSLINNIPQAILFMFSLIKWWYLMVLFLFLFVVISELQVRRTHSSSWVEGNKL